MSNLESDALMKALNRAQSKKPSAEDVVDTLFGRQKKSSNIIAKSKSKKSSAKMKFLKQIRDYNNLIKSNNLDAEKIDPKYDYDFSAFKKPEDFQTEAKRLSKKYYDLVEENGDELKSVIPFEEYSKQYLPKEVTVAATQPDPTDPTDRGSDMNVTSTNNAVISPESDGGIVVPDDDGSRVGDTGIVNGARDFVADGLGSIVDGVTDGRDARRDRRYVPKDVWLKETKRLKKEAEDIAKAKATATEAPEPVAEAQAQEEEKTVPLSDRFKMDENNILLNSLPLPLKQTIEYTKDTVNSGTKVVDQTGEHGLPATLRDAGRGLTAGVYDSADFITSLGGLAPNPVSEKADEIADNIRADMEIPDSEVERLGELASEGAVGGVAGSGIGRLVGKTYQGAKKGAEVFDKKAAKVAKEREQMALDHGQTPLEAIVTREKAYENLTTPEPKHSYLKAIVGDAQPVKRSAQIKNLPYTEPLPREEVLKRAIAQDKEHLKERVMSKGGYTAQDILNPVAGKMEYPTSTRMLDTAIHNAKRQFSPQTLLQENNRELEELWSQGNALDKAIKLRQQSWDQIPDKGADIGTAMGILFGASHE